MTAVTAVADRGGLLAAIGAVLGLGGPYLEAPPPVEDDAFLAGTGQGPPAGAGNVILGGAVDPVRGLVGWMEETVAVPQDGYVPVDITLNAAGPGLPVVRVPVPSYNPYFGCDVRWMGWAADGALVVVYAEKHRTIAVRLAPPDPVLRIYSVGPSLALAGDLLAHTGGDGLVSLLALPGLAPSLPLPCPPDARRVSLDSMPGPVLRWAEQVRAEAPDGVPAWQAGWRDGQVRRWRPPAPDQRGFPADPEEVWTRLRAALSRGRADRNADLADLIIGAVTAPWWHAPPPASYYGQLFRMEERPPWWFPVAVYRHMAATGADVAAARMLAWLDGLAAARAADEESGDGGWRPGWTTEDGAAHLAMQAIRLHAAPLAAACRAGRLPGYERAWPSREWRCPVPLAAFPPGFVKLWEQVPERFWPR